MLAHLAALAATVQNGWAAYSLIATLTGLGGVLLVAAALVFGAYLPAFLRHTLIAAGIVVLCVAGAFQVGRERGAHAQRELDTHRALAAERERADLAEAAARDIGAQAVRDAEDHAAALQKLKDLDHAAARHPDRDRIAVPRDLARGLRQLRDGGAR